MKAWNIITQYMHIYWIQDMLDFSVGYLMQQSSAIKDDSQNSVPDYTTSHSWRL
jgi:hypothetical protein